MTRRVFAFEFLHALPQLNGRAIALEDRFGAHDPFPSQLAFEDAVGKVSSRGRYRSFRHEQVLPARWTRKQQSGYDLLVPELPDVEGFRRFFERHASGKRVRRVRGDPAIVRNATPRAVDRALTERSFAPPQRIGKWLICRAEGPAVLLHFGMTGDLLWTTDAHAHDRMVFVFDDGELRYRDMRKFGGVWLARDEAAIEHLTGYLGPDALAVTRRTLDDVLAHRAGLKAVLMEQRNIAGLGNLLVDETLWQARVAPTRTAIALSKGERDKLFRAMRHVLVAWCREGFVPRRRSWLTGNRTGGGRCPRCGTKLTRATVAGRTTYWCRRCQL